MSATRHFAAAAIAAAVTLGLLRQFQTDLCVRGQNGCAGDPRLYDWVPKGYGLVQPVLFTARDGATIVAHVWATRAGPAERPGIVITKRLLAGARAALLVHRAGAGQNSASALRVKARVAAETRDALAMDETQSSRRRRTRACFRRRSKRAITPHLGPDVRDRRFERQRSVWCRRRTERGSASGR
ncbi:MAG: hypothetical protein ACJ76O_09975 [Gaiellaceae bacterium]